MTLVRQDPDEGSVWILTLNTPAPGGASYGFLEGMVMGGPIMTLETAAAADAEVGAPSVSFSDVGHTTEPDDDPPNAFYAPRLEAVPTIVQNVPIYPDDPRRSQMNEAEVTLQNQDGGLNYLASDWRLGGMAAVLHRGPARRPKAAPMSEFVRVAELRIANAFRGRDKLRIPLRNLAADLNMPAVGTFAGTGGREGTEAMKGGTKQVVYGRARNVAPIQLTQDLVYLVSDGGMEAFHGARDIGLPLVNGGNVAATYEELVAATCPEGAVICCLASGHIKVRTVPRELTVDVSGNKSAGGYGDGRPARVAMQLLRGPGSVPTSRASEDRFSGWPVREASLVVRGGSVAEALDALAAGFIGWWGADNFGTFIGDQIQPPETLTPVFSLDETNVMDEPSEAGLSRPPWWRATALSEPIDAVQAIANISELVTDPALRTFYSTQARKAVATDLQNFLRYPLAEGENTIPASLYTADAAQEVANLAMALYGVPRRAWVVPVRESVWTNPMVTPGACVNLTWPTIAPMLAGKRLLVSQVAGGPGRGELVLWG